MKQLILALLLISSFAFAGPEVFLGEYSTPKSPDTLISISRVLVKRATELQGADFEYGYDYVLKLYPGNKIKPFPEFEGKLQVEGESLVFDGEAFASKLRSDCDYQGCFYLSNAIVEFKVVEGKPQIYFEYSGVVYADDADEADRQYLGDYYFEKL